MNVNELEKMMLRLKQLTDQVDTLSGVRTEPVSVLEPESEVVVVEPRIAETVVAPAPVTETSMLLLSQVSALLPRVKPDWIQRKLINKGKNLEAIKDIVETAQQKFETPSRRINPSQINAILAWQDQGIPLGAIATINETAQEYGLNFQHLWDFLRNDLDGDLSGFHLFFETFGETFQEFGRKHDRARFFEAMRNALRRCCPGGIFPMCQEYNNDPSAFQLRVNSYLPAGVRLYRERDTSAWNRYSHTADSYCNREDERYD